MSESNTEFGHVDSGWAVEFNLEGVCACRTITMETESEADVFKQLLEDRNDVSNVEIAQV